MSLEQLCGAWLDAKAAEARANAERVKIELAIIDLAGSRPEGAQTTALPGFKVTITGKLTRKMDWAAWEKVKGQIPEALHPVRFKPELDETGVKWLAVNKPDLYLLLPIEVKPAKTAVEVKRVEGSV